MALRGIPEQQTVSEVESSPGSDNNAAHSQAPRLGVRLMIVILVGLALVAIYANVQKIRRDKIERVTGTPVATAARAAPRARCLVASCPVLSRTRIGIVSIRQCAGVGQGIVRAHALVSPDRLDTWKTQSETTRMPGAPLDRIERDLQDDVRLHFAIPAAQGGRLFFEMLRQLRDLHIGQPAVGLS